jgi:hypothetical protein
MSLENSDPKGSQTLPEQVKDNSSAKLAGAKEALKQKLLRAVMQQAMAEFGEPESIAEKAMKVFGSQVRQVPDASGRLRELLVTEITRSAIDSISDSDATASEIAETISVEHAGVRSVIDALRDRLTKSVEDAALDSIADAHGTAEEISRHVSLDKAEIQSVIEALRDRLTTSIREEGLRSFDDAEEAARSVYGTIPADHEWLTAVRQRVYDQLVSESSQNALARLENTNEIASQIRSDLGDTPEPVERIGGEVQAILTEEAKQRSLHSLSNTQEVASHVVSLLGDDPAVVSSAVEEVKSQLLDAISQRSVDSLSDRNETARAAMFKLGTSPKPVVEASEKLKDMLLQEIARRSTDTLEQTEEAADEAYAHVDHQSEKLQRIKEAVKAKILADVLSTAIHEINGEVGTAAMELSSRMIGHVVPEMNAGDLDAVAVELFEHESSEPMTPRDEMDDARSMLGEHLEVQDSESGPVEIEAGEQILLDSDVDEAAELEALLSSQLDEATPQFEAPTVEDIADGSTESHDSEAPEHAWRPLESFEAETTAVAEHSDHNDAAADAIEDEEPSQADDIVNDASPNDGLSDSVPSDTVYYVYGVMTAVGEAFDGPLPLGIQSGRVETVEFDGLSAVVSTLPADVFSGESLKANLGEAAWLQENVRKHASIIEQLRSRQTLLPMPFCTIFPNRDKVVRLLEVNYGQYFDSLGLVEGKQEWGVRIYSNTDVLQSKVNESDRRVEGAFGSISRGVSGYLKNEMDRMEQESQQDPIELMIEHCSQRSHEAMLALAAEGRFNPDRGSQERQGEHLVLNTAYLVEDAMDSEIRAEVERLKAEYAELGFRFELTGPWPPYHFVGAEGNTRVAVRSSD